MAAVDMQAAGPALPALTTVAEAGSSRHQVAELPEGFGYALKRRVLGAPLVTEQLKNERLSRPLALGVLSCDGRSYPPLTGRLLHDHTAVGIGDDGRPAMINPAYELLG